MQGGVFKGYYGISLFLAFLLLIFVFSFFLGVGPDATNTSTSYTAHEGKRVFTRAFCVCSCFFRVVFRFGLIFRRPAGFSLGFLFGFPSSHLACWACFCCAIRTGTLTFYLLSTINLELCRCLRLTSQRSLSSQKTHL